MCTPAKPVGGGLGVAVGFGGGGVMSSATLCGTAGGKLSARMAALCRLASLADWGAAESGVVPDAAGGVVWVWVAGTGVAGPGIANAALLFRAERVSPR